MNVSERRKALRAILGGNTSYHPAPVYDALSARMARDLGFEFGIMGGSMASIAVLGDPDLVLLTLSELAEQVRRCSRASDIPLLIDADHGYGNALNVRRTVEEMEAAGAAGLTVEDTLLPIAYGAQRTQFIPVEEGVGKMKAALDARTDREFAVIARIGTAPANGLDDAIARAQAYEAAGVDAVFFVGLKTRSEVEAVAKATKGPLTLGISGGELADRAFFASRRVKFSLQGQAPLSAGIRATYEALKDLRAGVAPADVKGQASPELLKQVTRDADHAAHMASYLGGAKKG